MRFSLPSVSAILYLLLYFQPSAQAMVNATATLTILGAEQQAGQDWDSQNITVYFNSYSETITSGQFSSPASIASGLAAKFCHDYIRYGLYAKAAANNNSDLNVITFQLLSGSFGPISVTGATSSFLVDTSNWPGSNNDLSITSVTPSFASIGDTVVIRGRGFGASGGLVYIAGTVATQISWTDSFITIRVPTGIASGNTIIGVTTASGGSASAPFAIAQSIQGFPSCPVP